MTKKRVIELAVKVVVAALTAFLTARVPHGTDNHELYG